MIDLGGMGALGNLFGGNSMMSLGDLSSLLSGTQNFNGMFDLFKPGELKILSL